MADRSFPHTEFDEVEYELILARMRDIQARKLNAAIRMSDELRSSLKEIGIQAQLRIEKLSPFAVWQKMRERKVAIEGVDDLTSIVVITTADTCYQALGAVHTAYPAIPSRFDDYISTPDTGDYSSLDTSVVGPDRQRIRVKIRTQDMDQHAAFLEKGEVDLEKLHGVMQERLLVLENLMGTLPSGIPSIGHNQPPEEIEPRPLTEDDRRLILDLIESLKQHPVIPNSDPEVIVEASKTLRSYGQKVGGYLSTKADSFLTEAIKEAGKETGKWAARLAIWSIIAKTLFEVAEAVFAWIREVSPTLF